MGAYNWINLSLSMQQAVPLLLFERRLFVPEVGKTVHWTGEAFSGHQRSQEGTGATCIA